MLIQVMLLAPAAGAQVQPAPYQPPELIEVDLPSWVAPFAPIAALPLWAQAALVSAVIAGLIFIVPILSRWLLRLGQDAEKSIGGPGQ
jgi:hypothetical protein